MSVPSGWNWQGIGERSLDWWESATGYHPFQATVSTTRFYDPPGANRRSNQGLSLYGGDRVLDFGCGLVSLTSLVIGFDSLTQTGTQLVPNQDFWLEPVNSPLEEYPYQRVRFLVPVFGIENSIAVTGVFGYASTVPEDAFQAMIDYGFSATLSQLNPGAFSQPTSWQEESVVETWSPVLIQRRAQELLERANLTASRYRRVP